LPDYFQGGLFWDFELFKVGAVAIVFGLLSLAMGIEGFEVDQLIGRLKDLPNS
jgi:hypothetical protein